MNDRFDRFAELVSRHVARAWFFTACVLLVLVWAPSYFLFGSFDTWQLVINTATTIVTFLMVALLQNTQDRAIRAINHKLDLLATGMAEVLDSTSDLDRAGKLAAALRKMAGVEMEPSA